MVFFLLEIWLYIITYSVLIAAWGRLAQPLPLPVLCSELMLFLAQLKYICSPRGKSFCFQILHWERQACLTVHDLIGETLQNKLFLRHNLYLPPHTGRGSTRKDDIYMWITGRRPSASKPEAKIGFSVTLAELLSIYSMWTETDTMGWGV